jgi:hypothetical protein
MRGQEGPAGKITYIVLRLRMPTELTAGKPISRHGLKPAPSGMATRAEFFGARPEAYFPCCFLSGMG